MRRLFTVSMAAAVFLVLFLALTMVGSRLAPVSTVSAAGGWTAYNDCNYITSGGVITGNITVIKCITDGLTGQLRNYSTGAYMAITLTVNSSNVLIQSSSTSGQYGGEPIAGTDAYTLFHTTAAITGGVRVGTTTARNGFVRLTVAGLNPAMVYKFATVANRNNSSYTNRFTTFIIGDVTTATNTSSVRPGVGVTRTMSVFYQDSSTIWTGYNTNNGYVARWTNIQPGADGDFVVTATNTNNEEGYGFTVFMLEEVDPTAVEIGSFSAAPAGDRIVLRWQTASEIDRLGFNVYRATSVDGPRILLNEDLIASPLPPGSSAGADYSFEDLPVKSGARYFYWLEDVDMYGVTSLHGPFEAAATWRLSKGPRVQ
jgi:hypothetical protein